MSESLLDVYSAVSLTTFMLQHSLVSGQDNVLIRICPDAFDWKKQDLRDVMYHQVTAIGQD